MRGHTDLSLAPLDRRVNGKQSQGTNRGADASPTRPTGYGSSGSHRAGPFPPVPRPGTTGTPYLLGGTRRPPFTSSSQSDRERERDPQRGGDGVTISSAALPRLPEPTAGGGGGGGSCGTRYSSPHAGRGNRLTTGRASPAENIGGGGGGGGLGTASSPPPLIIPSGPGAITWAHVRDAQQHAWAESGYHKAQQYLVAAAAAAATAAVAQQQPNSPPHIQSSGGDLPWGPPDGPLAGGASTQSLTFPSGNSSNAAALGSLLPPPPPQLVLSPAATSVFSRGRGGVFGGFGTDLAELERGLRDRERDLVNGFSRSSWSAGASSSPWIPERTIGSPPRSNGRAGEAAAAGLLAFENMVGPQFSALGLLEGPLSPSGGGPSGSVPSVLALASGRISPQMAQQQQQQVHTLQRRTLMLRLPQAWGSVGLEMPAMVVQDTSAGSGGGACLLVLPSDKPPTRLEAAAVEALLLEMLRDPEMAAARAASWRAEALGSLCSEAIACLHEASKLKHAPGAGGGTAGGVDGGGGANGAAGGDSGAAKWQLRGLDGVELSAPSILGPFTTLLQPSLQAHTAAIDAQRAGLASAHARTPTGTSAAAVAANTGCAAAANAGTDAGDRRGPRRLRGSHSEAPNLRSCRSLMTPFTSTSLTVGVCVCLADLIRQVEVQCCERGRALASTWNTFMVAHQDSMDALRRRTGGLQREVEQLTSQLAERRDFTREIEMLEFLKRENARYKSREADLLAKGLLTLQTAPGARDGSRLVVKAGGALGEALDSELNSRIARLRWQQAVYTLGTQTKRVAFQSGFTLQKAPPPNSRLTAGGPEAEAMIIKLSLLQRLTLAVERVQRRRQAAEARRKAAEEARSRGGGGAGAGAAGLAGASPAELAAAVAAAGPGVGLKLLEGLDPEDAAHLLSVLSPEAQVVLLGSLQELKRAEVLAAMTDGDRAQAVAVMSSGMRAHTARVLGRGMWMTTMRCIKENSQLGARLLSGMEHQEAVDELVTWTTAEQQDVFAALDLPTAARLLLGLPPEIRQKLLMAMAPHLAANILSAMLPAPAAATLDELDFARAIAILMAMDPVGAANILQEVGCTRAAEVLLGMDNLDVRNAILECMMPRMAAETVLEMDMRAHRAAAAAAANVADVDVAGLSFVGPGGGAAGTIGVSSTGGPAATGASPFPGTEALVEMPSASADKIMGFMTIQDKAAVLARMDPERAAEQLAHLGPFESVALLACLADAAQVMVVEALKQEERDAMMKVLADASGYKFRGGRNKGKGRKTISVPGKTAANAKNAAASTQGTATATAIPVAAAGHPTTTGVGLGTSAASPQLPSITSMPVPSSPGMMTSLLPRMSIGGGGGGLTPRISGGGSGLAPGVAGYKSDIAASMAAAVGRRTLEFIDEYSDGEGPYDEGLAMYEGRGRRWSQDSDPETDGVAGGTGDGAGPGTGDGAGGTGSGDGATAGCGGGGASGAPGGRQRSSIDGVTGSGHTVEGEFDDFADARGSVEGLGSYTTGGRKGGRARAGGDGQGAGRGGGDRDAPEDDINSGDDGAAAAAGRVSPVVGAELSFTGFSSGGIGPGASRHSVSTAIGLAAASSGGATVGTRRYRTSEVDMQHLSRQQQQQVQQLHAQAMARRGGGRGDTSPVSPASPTRVPAAGSSTPSRMTPQQGLRSSPHAMAAGNFYRGTADGVGTPGASGSSRGYSTGGLGPGPGGGANNLSSIKAAFRINRQHQQLAQAQVQFQSQGMSPTPGLAEVLRGAAQQGAMTTGSRQSAVSQMLLRDFRDIAGVGPPQASLNPKNVRLATAMAQHRAARPRPKGWLMGLVESVYKDGEALQRRMGHMEALRRQSVPEIVFGHFSNKYGQRSLVDEYAACLANTLAQHRGEDLRLETFARFLTEQWDFATFFDFLTANNLALQPSKVLCIEYPREAGRDEQYPWLCSHKAAAIADFVMGPRSQALRDRFNEALLVVSVPADDADVEKLKREPRYAAAAAEAATGGLPLPDRFYRLPRPRFLALLASEISRLNAAITRMARGRFEALDLVGNEVVPVGAVPGYLSSVLTSKSSQAGDRVTVQPVQGVQEAAQSFVNDALAYQQDPAAASSSPEPTGGAGPETKLTMDAWVAASVHCPVIRDHFKLRVLRPRRMDADGVDDFIDDGTTSGGDNLLGGFLLGLTRRHTKIMATRLIGCLRPEGGVSGNAADAALVSELNAAVDKAVSGGDKFRAYAQMLLAIIKQQVAAAVGMLVGDRGTANDAAGPEVEDALCRLEDCALIMLKQSKYLIQCSTPEVQIDLIRRLAPQSRIFMVGRQLMVWRQHRATVRNMAALVVQSLWRKHLRWKKAATSAQAQSQSQLAAEASSSSAPRMSGTGGVDPRSNTGV